MATWPNGLTLVAQDDRFAGWSLSPEAGAGMDDGLGTMAGITRGSTRSDLESAYAAEVGQTTLGTEFTAGGLSGLLAGKRPPGDLTKLWAGHTKPGERSVGKESVSKHRSRRYQQP